MGVRRLNHGAARLQFRFLADRKLPAGPAEHA
jgi:hypothetical protein